MDEWLWFAVTAAAVAALVLGVAALVGRRAPDRLGDKATGDSEPELLLGDLTEALSRGVPGEERDRAEIVPELDRAGIYGPNVLAEYRALRTVLVLVPLLLAAAVALLVEPRQIVYAAGAGVLLAGLGYALPRLYVSMRASARNREIERGLPVFSDMLSIALLAGQGLTGALRRVTAQLRPAFPGMTEELEIVGRHTEMLNLYAAFELWARRSQSAEVRNLALILGQSQKLGNDVTAALLEYATHLRSDVRQKADARAQRASFWMLFPTILCLWIPTAVVMVGPVWFEFADRRQKVKEELQQTSGDNPFTKSLVGDKGKAGDGK